MQLYTVTLTTTELPEFTQSFNRYSYCLNNPLKYTDPSGERFLDQFFTAITVPMRLLDGILNSQYDPGYIFKGEAPEGNNYFYNNYMMFNEHNSNKTIFFTDYSAYEWQYEYVTEGTGVGFGPSYAQLDNDGDWKLAAPGSPVVYKYTVNRKMVSKRKNTIQGGGGNSAYNDVPTWIDKANTGVGAFMVGNNAKEQLISYAARTGDIGKTGAKYLKVVRGTGVAGSVVGMGISGYNIYNDYSQGGIDAVNGWDIADFGIGAVGLTTTGLVTLGLISNPIGWVVAGGVAVYFGARLIYDVTTKE